MERAVEIFAVINLGVIGLSHILAPKAWISFFVLLREKGDAGVIGAAALARNTTY